MHLPQTVSTTIRALIRGASRHTGLTVTEILRDVQRTHPFVTRNNVVAHLTEINARGQLARVVRSDEAVAYCSADAR